MMGRVYDSGTANWGHDPLTYWAATAVLARLEVSGVPVLESPAGWSVAGGGQLL